MACYGAIFSANSSVGNFGIWLKRSRFDAESEVLRLMNPGSYVSILDKETSVEGN